MAVTEAAKEADLLEGYAINLFSCKMWQSEYTTQEQSILMRGSGSLNSIHLFLRFILKREYVWNVEKNCSLWQVLALTGLASCSLRVDWKLTAKYSYPYRESSLGLKQAFVDDLWIVANVEISCLWLGMLGEKEALSGWGWGSSKQL